MKHLNKSPFAADSLQALAARRAQLQQEAEMALILLESKAKQTFSAGKRWIAARTSVPAAVTALAAAGAQHFAGPVARQLTHTSWPVEIQRSLEAYEAKTENKWTAFLPLVVKAAMAYNSPDQPLAPTRTQAPVPAL